MLAGSGSGSLRHSPPQPGPSTALNHRPISVTSALYRLWGTIRWKTLRLWQATWINDEQYGFHAGRSTQDAAALTLVLMALSSLLVGVQLRRGGLRELPLP